MPNTRVENGVELFIKPSHEAAVMTVHCPPLDKEDGWPHYGVMLYRDTDPSEHSYWMPEIQFASFNLEMHPDASPCAAYFSREEFDAFLNALDFNMANAPEPTARPKLVYSNAYGNDTNSSSIAVWHVPMGRDKLPDNDPDFNDDGPESEYDGEPTIMVMLHNADWCSMCYIPMSRVQTIRRHLLKVIADQY